MFHGNKTSEKNTSLLIKLNFYSSNDKKLNSLFLVFFKSLLKNKNLLYFKNFHSNFILEKTN
jgi:hypothetical protein